MSKYCIPHLRHPRLNPAPQLRAVELPLADFLCQFYPAGCDCCAVELLEAEHRVDTPLHFSVILPDDVIQD